MCNSIVREKTHRVRLTMVAMQRVPIATKKGELPLKKRRLSL
jgi:hypothetical protein